MSDFDVAAVVIAYNPSSSSLINMVLNSSQFSKTYIVDNSDGLTNWDAAELNNPAVRRHVILMQKNVGVAAALNVGLEHVVADGYNWAVTLDQDSLLDTNFVHYIGSVAKNEDRLGIISPIHLHNGLAIERNAPKEGYILTSHVMMSGNLLSLKAYKECGKFSEELFIDYVDTEYCLRLNSQGFKVLLTSDVQIAHELGQSKWFDVMGMKLKPTNHSPLRRYYITRNRIYLYGKLKKLNIPFVIKDLFMFVKEVLFILLFEQDKIKKIRAIILGIFDANSKTMGKSMRKF
ncbi:glycosyltransferase family 2 protein [Deinococcus alpinitundrae]|uniref:glycosyltransferase family 2 protein n=1 Tax=Deinococcus alpinitundrae TaxID=468913 RepID=UPI00137B2DFA|nr:glycosyltransferase family 2 protein [Deinococcus alpinitundrae]